MVLTSVAARLHLQCTCTTVGSVCRHTVARATSIPMNPATATPAASDLACWPLARNATHTTAGGSTVRRDNAAHDNQQTYLSAAYTSPNGSLYRADSLFARARNANMRRMHTIAHFR